MFLPINMSLLRSEDKCCQEESLAKSFSTQEILSTDYADYIDYLSELPASCVSFKDVCVIGGIGG
jgi:hypothetical protein